MLLFALLICLLSSFPLLMSCSGEDSDGDDDNDGNNFLDDDTGKDDDDIGDDDDNGDDDYYDDDDYYPGEVVYATGDVSIKIDSAGAAHVIYYLLESYYQGIGYYDAWLIYETNETGSWESEILASNLIDDWNWEYFGDFHSLELDGQGNLHLIYNSVGTAQGYYYETPSQLDYMTRDNATGTWGGKSTISVDGGDSNALILDSQSNLHAIHVGSEYQFDPTIISYTSNQSGQWLTTRLDEEEIYWGTSLTITDAGEMDAIYLKDRSWCDLGVLGWSCADAYITSNTTGTWTSPVKIEDQINEISIAGVVDSQGRLHLLMAKCNTGLVYKKRVAGNWQSAVLSNLYATFNINAAIDDGDNIHAVFTAYPDENGDNLYYVTFPAGQTTPVTPENIYPGGGGETAIDLDNNGAVHALITSRGDVVYINNTTGQWESEIIYDDLW